MAVTRNLGVEGAGTTMENVQLDVPHICVVSLVSATKKVVGFSLEYCAEEIKFQPAQYIQIQSKGAFRSVMCFRLEQSFESAVLEKMLGGREPTPEIRDLYLGEYVNILSGHALTMINEAVGQSSRLTVPIVDDQQQVEDISYPNDFVVYFTSEYGNMELSMSYEM